MCLVIYVNVPFEIREDEVCNFNGGPALLVDMFQGPFLVSPGEFWNNAFKDNTIPSFPFHFSLSFRILHFSAL
jgi:hypothetical protein